MWLLHGVAAASSSLQLKIAAGMSSQQLTWPAGAPWERAHLPGSTNVQGGVGGRGDDQPNARRETLLEAGLKSTQSHNVHLQHHVAFLEAQMIGQLGHIAQLQTRVRALESELTSLKANLHLGPNPVPARKAVNSVATDSVAAHPVAAGTTPPPSPASASAPDPLPGQQHEPAPPNPTAAGVVANYAWDLRPQGADGSEAALPAAGLGKSGAVPPGTTEQAARSLSSQQVPEPAANSSPSALDHVQVEYSADPTSTKTAPAPAEPSSAIVTEQAENSSRCNSAPTTVPASATSRPSLHDFWADSNSANSPPASNTRNRGLRGEVLALELNTTFLAQNLVVACWKVLWDADFV